MVNEGKGCCAHDHGDAADSRLRAGLLESKVQPSVQEEKMLWPSPTMVSPQSSTVFLSQTSTKLYSPCEQKRKCDWFESRLEC